MDYPTPTRDASPGDHVAPRQKVAAGTGGIYETLSNHAASQIAYPIFNIGLGVSPGLVGFALAIPRLWDAFIDPWVGAVSDRTRSRFGRRRPHMFVAALSSGLLFAAIWAFPRGMSPGYYFWHFLATSLLFFTATAFFTVPWQALLAEMTPDYHERTRVQAARSILATFGALLLPWLFWATQRPFFVDAIEGVRYVGVGIGIALALAGLIPALFVREPPSATPRPTTIAPPPCLTCTPSSVCSPSSSSYFYLHSKIIQGTELPSTEEEETKKQQ
ncbi:MAG: MFS transporter [Verrucomicrobiota bacterium]